MTTRITQVKRPPPKKTNHEAKEINYITSFLTQNYSGVEYLHDESDSKMSKAAACQMVRRRSGRGFPDLYIFEPSGSYPMLIIEHKAEGTRLYKKDGETPVDLHVEEQIRKILKLQKKGFYVCFTIGVSMACTVIQAYMRGEPFELKGPHPVIPEGTLMFRP